MAAWKRCAEFAVRIQGRGRWVSRWAPGSFQSGCRFASTSESSARIRKGDCRYAHAARENSGGTGGTKSKRTPFPKRRQTNIINLAEADRVRTEAGALARAGLFTNQIPAYEAAPSVYAERLYLQSFARSTANARKFILLTTNTHDVLQFDLQDKIRSRSAVARRGAQNQINENEAEDFHHY